MHPQDYTGSPSIDIGKLSTILYSGRNTQAPLASEKVSERTNSNFPYVDLFTSHSKSNFLPSLFLLFSAYLYH